MLLNNPFAFACTLPAPFTGTTYKFYYRSALYPSDICMITQQCILGRVTCTNTCYGPWTFFFILMYKLETYYPWPKSFAYVIFLPLLVHVCCLFYFLLIKAECHFRCASLFIIQCLVEYNGLIVLRMWSLIGILFCFAEWLGCDRNV